MNTEKKVIYIKEGNTLDVKDNSQMVEWTQDIFFDLNQKLDEHFRKEQNQSNENI
ncbi:MAG: hypothetical protein P8M34_05505 [Saprospiraceae bacterium]|nr:hypothetical protein [Saprospiraceae bacterium]|tara:strand:- start:1352 stop:1516 length:165 start_codon:yes stop_codon:yes gene_type:complete